METEGEGVKRRIYKYVLRLGGELELPVGAEILCIQTQYNEPTLWALVDPDAPMESRRIRTYGTGGRVPDNLEWLGTFQLDGGGLVFHAFEEVKA